MDEKSLDSKKDMIGQCIDEFLVACENPSSAVVVKEEQGKKRSVEASASDEEAGDSEDEKPKKKSKKDKKSKKSKKEKVETESEAEESEEEAAPVAPPVKKPQPPVVTKSGKLPPKNVKALQVKAITGKEFMAKAPTLSVNVFDNQITGLPRTFSTGNRG
jgi:hypothetical protein